jgi:hypothetical protein
MFNKLTPVSGVQTLLDFANKPLVEVDETLNRFLHERFCVATLFGSKTGKFGLHLSREMQFHSLKLKARKVRLSRSTLVRLFAPLFASRFHRLPFSAI